MITTSSYILHEDHPDAISISRVPPRYWIHNKKPHYKLLAPEYQLWKRFMLTDLGWESQVRFTYEFLYQLQKLDPLKVIADLSPDAILLCWELGPAAIDGNWISKETFCHRHVVAKWLSQYVGYEIKEKEVLVC